MLTPSEIWPMIAGAAVVVFGAGQVVEKVRNGRYVLKEMCAQKHLQEDERWKRIDRNMERIWRRIDGQNDGDIE